MAWKAGDFGNFPGLPVTPPPDIEVLDGRELGGVVAVPSSWCSRWCSCLRIWWSMPDLFSLLRGKGRCRALFTAMRLCVDHVKSLVMWTPRNSRPAPQQPHQCGWGRPPPSFSYSSQSAPWFFWRGRRGCCPGTTLLSLWPPPCSLTHRCR